MTSAMSVRRSKAIGVAAYATAAILLVPGCARPTAAKQPAQPLVSATSSGSAPSQGGSGPGGSPSRPAASSSAAVGADTLPDGKVDGIITAVDTKANTVTFVLVDLLTGEAMKRYLKAHPDATDPYYSPAYVVVNNDPKLRTMPFAAKVTVRVAKTDGGSPQTIKLADLPAHLKTDGFHEHDGRSAFPFHITVLHGQVTALEELPPA
jgi:ABC-type phosphate transport system substrate-binding protein